MGLPITLSELPARLTAGAFILSSGLDKRGADEETAKGLHGFASGTYPAVASVPPRQFVQGLATAEIVLGAALLTPLVPTVVAGAGLTAFSGGLLGLYLTTPGMRKEGSLAPTPEGLSLAKDSWLLGIGLSILTRGLIERRPRITVEKAEKRARKAARRAAREARLDARRTGRRTARR